MEKKDYVEIPAYIFISGVAILTAMCWFVVIMLKLQNEIGIKPGIERSIIRRVSNGI